MTIIRYFSIFIVSFFAVSCNWWSSLDSNENFRAEKENCIFVVSKVPPEHLSVYEVQGSDTVFLKSYPVSLGVNLGPKKQKGDGRTPETVGRIPFRITQISDSRSWTTEAGDSRGRNAFGPWFLKLDAGGFSGIGIYGSNNSSLSVPGRSSEGCIVLREDDIKELHDKFAGVGTPVFVLQEGQGPLSFEDLCAAPVLPSPVSFDAQAGQMLQQNAQVKAYPFELYNGGKVYFSNEKEVKVPTSPKKGPTFGTGNKVVVADMVIPECLAAPAEPIVKKPETKKETASPEKKEASVSLGTCTVSGTRQCVRKGDSSNPKDNPIWKKDGTAVCPEDGERLEILEEVGDYFKVKFSGETVFINKVSVVKN